MTPQPLNSSFAEDIKQSFARQAIMQLIGAELGRSAFETSREMPEISSDGRLKKSMSPGDRAIICDLNLVDFPA